MTQPTGSHSPQYRPSPMAVAGLTTVAVLMIIVGSLTLSRCADSRTSPPPAPVQPAGAAAQGPA